MNWYERTWCPFRQSTQFRLQHLPSSSKYSSQICSVHQGKLEHSFLPTTVKEPPVSGSAAAHSLVRCSDDARSSAKKQNYPLHFTQVGSLYPWPSIKRDSPLVRDNLIQHYPVNFVPWWTSLFPLLFEHTKQNVSQQVGRTCERALKQWRFCAHFHSNWKIVINRNHC